MRFGILAIAGLLTSCGTVVSSVVVAPDLVEDSPALMERAATELRAMGPACDPVEPAGDCSAVARLVRDYGIARDQIRALTGG